MKLSDSLPQEEFFVWVTYDIDNECAYTEKIKNDFRCRFWVTKEGSASIMFVNIPDGFILPGQRKKVLAYTIDPEYAQELIKSNKVYWGSAVCSLGTIEII